MLIMKLQYLQVETPIGDFNIIIKSETAVVCTSGFGKLSELQKRLPKELASLKLEKANYHNSYGKLINAYFKGDVQALNDIPHKQNGSNFYQKTWKVMSTIKPGKTISYKELAIKSGNSSAVRPAGTACAQNRIPLIVPCHRIIKSDGSAGNYLYGSSIKKYLLEHERKYTK